MQRALASLVKLDGMTKKAARLYRQFQPGNYRITLSINPEAMTFGGSVIINGAKTGSPAKRLVFHQKGLKITAAKISRFDKSASKDLEISRINLHKSFDEVRLHTKETLYPGRHRVEMTFTGRISDAMHGIYPCYFDKRRKKLIATQFESHHAREAFPCIDEPEAKAVFELTLETPSAEVIGNTPIKKTMDKKQITEFEPSPKMSSYLLAFAFGELKSKEAKTKSGTVVRAYATPANYKLLGFALDTAVRCVDFFEDYFQTPYPLAKLDLVGLPDFSSGAMENWGLITFRESIFLVDPKTTSIETKQITALVIAHEIAHQWFGNLVTMRWWDDLWLNESFANLMEYVAVDKLFPEWRIFEHFVGGEMTAAFQRDSLPNIQAIRTKVRHPDELATLFDPAIVYAKGGCMLHMTRNLIGDEAFRHGLKDYFQKHRYGSSEASDLWQALSRSAKMDINVFIDNWLNRPGFPVVEIDYQPGSDVFSTSQQRLVTGKQATAADTIWQIPLAPNIGDRLLLTDKKASFKISRPLAPLIFNNEGQSYYQPRYRKSAHLSSIRQAVTDNKLSTINRLQLISGYSLMERALLTKNADNLQLLETFQNETEEPIWGAMAGMIGDAKRLVIGQKPHEQRLNQFTAQLLQKMIKQLGWNGRPTDSPQTQRLRNLVLSLGAAAEMPSVVAEAKTRFKRFKKPSDLAADIRDVVYYVTARFGAQVDFDKLLKTYKATENADERIELAAALTATRNPRQIKTLIAMLKTDDVRRQDTANWFVWLLRNHYARQATWQWLVSNWDWIEEHFASDKSYDDYPKYAAVVFSRPDELARYKKFFLPKTIQLALERAINLGIEEIESRVAWRAKNEAGTKKWLANWVKTYRT